MLRLKIACYFTPTLVINTTRQYEHFLHYCQKAHFSFILLPLSYKCEIQTKCEIELFWALT